MSVAKRPGAVRVEVTAADIKKGKRKIAASCPIALAIRRCTGAEEVSVASQIWADHYYVPATAAALRFIGRFDRGEPVQPFTFTLRGWQ